MLTFFLFSLCFSDVSVKSFSVSEVIFGSEPNQEISIVVPYSAVIFSDLLGFHGVVGTGEFHVRQFGIINSSYEAIGAYFGGQQGKVRLYNRNRNSSLGLYILVPPTECSTFWITTSATDSFSLGFGGLNGSIIAGHTYCLWYVNPRSGSVNVGYKGTEKDVFLLYTKSETSVNLQSGLTKLNGPISLFVYKPSGVNGHRLNVDCEGSQELPVVHAKTQRNTMDFVLYAERQSLGENVRFPWGEKEGEIQKEESVSPELLRKITSGLCLLSLAVIPVLIIRNGGREIFEKHRQSKKPVVEVAAFTKGARVVGVDQEELVNNATFFPSVDPS
jgi:hypothetical protein